MDGGGFTLCILDVYVLYFCIQVVCCLSIHVGVTVIKHHRMEELLGSWSSPGRAGGYNSEKKKKRRKETIVCTYSKWQEWRKQSSFIVSRQFGQDSFQNGDKLQRQKILQLFLIVGQGCKNLHHPQRSQWTSQHCQRNGLPVPEHSGWGVGRKQCFLLGAVVNLLLTGNHPSVSWVVQGTGGGCSVGGIQQSLSGWGRLWFLLPVCSGKHAASWVFLQKNWTGICWQIMFKGLHCIIGMTCSQKVWN